MMDDAFNIIDKDNDDILLVAGDSDYVPVVAKLIERGFEVEVAFWGQAAKEFCDTAANFFELDGKLDEFIRAAPSAAA